MNQFTCFFLCAKTALLICEIKQNMHMQILQMGVVGVDVVGFVKKIFVPNLIAQINRRNQPIFIFVKCYSKFKLLCNQTNQKKMTNLTRNSKNNIGGRLFLHLRIGTIGIAPSRIAERNAPPPHIGKSYSAFGFL